MKTIYILLTALFVGFTSIQAHAQETSPLRFDVTEWSFGNIREDGGQVSHTFEFTNKGDTPVVLDRVTTSCGCTTPQYPLRPVAPGERSLIKVTFDPVGFSGDFSKSITVVSGSGKYRDFLTIAGHIVPRPKTVEEEFPNDMGGGLRVSSSLVTFRSISQGRSVSMVVEYINTSTATTTLSFEPVEGSGLLDISAPETMCAGCRGEIIFTYDLTEKTAYGQIYDVVKPVVDGTPSAKTIYTAATGIDNFEGTDISLAPRFSLDASFHNFGEVRRRTMPYTFLLTASNYGSGVLHIRNVSSTAGLQCTLQAGMTIAAGTSLPFEVIFYSNKYSQGEVQGSIQLVVDDPMRPTREIRIAAIIK